MQDEMILFHPATNKFCLLNRSAALLWERLERPCTRDDLSATLRGAFDEIDPATAEQDVGAALKQFTELGFVVGSE